MSISKLAHARKEKVSRKFRSIHIEPLEKRVLLAGDVVAEEDTAQGGTDQQVEIDPRIAEIQTLRYRDFRTLSAEEVVHLTPQQIATIPSSGWLRTIGARGSFTDPQVQALNVAKTGIKDLSETQRTALTEDQIQSLHYREFRYLSATQVPSLTGDQVATIRSAGWLRTISARASLTGEQIQSLRVDKTGLKDLTETQRAALTSTQIQSLKYRDFRYLNADQVPHLTIEQIASIPSRGWLRTISARDALTEQQIPGLNVAKTGIRDLSEAGRSALTTEQIQSLKYSEFRYLSAEQIPQLTAEQVASIPNRGWLRSISARTALTAEQIPALRTDKTGIRDLSESQIAALSQQQVQGLSYQNFRYLDSDQILWLTDEQIASIPNRGWFRSISAKAAITAEQVPYLQVAKIGLSELTEAQRGALSQEQVRSLSYHNFRYLNAQQNAWLTAEQIASIPSAGWMRTIAALDALTAEQIPHLQVQNTGIGELSEQQRTHLTEAQIQSLTYRDFGLLTSDQIVGLTGEQIASIPSSGWMRRITDPVRATLSDAQVQHINVAKVSIALLTPGQRDALTIEQIRSLNYRYFRYLTAEQIVHLTNDQLASIPNSGQFKSISAEARAALTREQLLHISEHVLTQMVGLPSDFAVTEHEHQEHTGGPHDGDPARAAEHMAIFALVPHDEATHISVDSGVWSDPEVWKDGLVPDAGAKVLIRTGDTIVFDSIIRSDDALNTVRVDGELSFDHDDDTQLFADTIVIDPAGELVIGTDEQAIVDGVTARIVFADNGAIDQSWDPRQLSRGLVSHGRVQINGQEVTPYVSLEVDPWRGDTTLVLDEVPVNWDVGDRLVLTGTQSNYNRNQDEELEIVAIVDNIVTIDADSETEGLQGLAYHHVTPDGDDGRSPDPHNLSPQGDLFKVYVSNVNRNVVLISENPHDNASRGHVMFMHNQDVDINNAGFYGLGRSDKRNPSNDPQFDEHGKLIENTGLNPRGRYSVHFHRAGTSYEDSPGYVNGSVVVDSPGLGFVNHESYVHMTNNVAFHVVGSSFFTEVGSEIGSFVGNLSINNSGSGDGLESREDIFDFGHGGHGFWFQGPLVEAVDNIAAGSAGGAFVFFTRSAEARIDADLLEDPAMAGNRASIPVGSAPLKKVEDNVSFAARHGLETWFHMTHMNDGQSVIDGHTAWNTRSSALHTPYTGRTTISDATLIGRPDRPRSTAISRNNVTNQMTYDNVTAIGWSVGISVPVNRTTVIHGGHFSAVRAIQIDRAHDTLREVDITGDPVFETLDESQLRGRTQYDLYMNGGFQMKNFDLETLFTPDIVRLGTIRFNNHQLFYFEQAHDYVPFVEGASPDFIPPELMGKTNAEIYSEFGIATAGAIAPDDAVRVDRINGLLGSRVDYPDRLQMLSRKYTNQLADYQLSYIDHSGDRVTQDPVDLREGWNLLTHDVGGETRTFFVFGDTIAPTFSVSPRQPLAVNPDGLRFGFTVRGSVFDNSTGRKSFKRRFNDLESRPIVTRDDDSQFILLEFTIRDKAGNETLVSLELNLDPDAPLVPGTQQRDLPDRDIPVTLEELLKQYII